MTAEEEAFEVFGLDGSEFDVFQHGFDDFVFFLWKIPARGVNKRV